MVQVFWSSQETGPPPVQLPWKHFLPVTQALSSSQESALKTETHPSWLSHELVVQGLPSLQSKGCPMTHVPSWQISPSEQMSPKKHGSVFGVKMHPSSGSHESSVQGLLSSQTTTPLPTQVPSEQISIGVHASPSSQLPNASWVTHPVPGIQVASSQGPDSHSTGFP